MNKKGISPLIAIVLLIGATLVISGLVYTFVNKAIEDQKEITETETSLALICSQEVNLEQDNFEICGDETNLKLFVKNIGSANITGLRIQILTLGDSQFIFKNESLYPYVKTPYPLEDLKFDVKNIIGINLFPVIEFGDCPKIEIEVSEIYTCCGDGVCDSWEEIGTIYCIADCLSAGGS